MLNHTPTTTLATSIRCIECRRPWLVDDERWRIKVLYEADVDPEPVPYCPDCHAREFGEG